MKKWSLLFINLLILFNFSGCNDLIKEPEPGITRDDVVGIWDAYVAVHKDGRITEYPSDILLNYEYGFKLNADGTYHPRYFYSDSLGFHTNSGIVHHWELVDGNKLVFGDYDTQGVLKGFSYEVIKLEDDELWIGKEIHYRLKKEASH